MHDEYPNLATPVVFLPDNDFSRWNTPPQHLRFSSKNILPPFVLESTPGCWLFDRPLYARIVRQGFSVARQPVSYVRWELLLVEAVFCLRARCAELNHAAATSQWLYMCVLLPPEHLGGWTTLRTSMFGCKK